MAKSFLAASSLRMDALESSLGNYEYTQAWTVCFQHKPTGNNGGSVLAKMGQPSVYPGWEIFARAGTTNTQYAAEVGNTGTLRAAVRTTNEFAAGSTYSVIVDYDGSGVVGGFHIYVNNVLQTLTTIANALAGNTILNSSPLQIGARAGTSSPSFFLTGDLSRVMLFTGVMSSGNRAIYQAGGIPTTNLVFWQELTDVGATLQPDYSGNGHTFAINFAQSYLAGPNADQFPVLPTTGITRLAGRLTRGASPLFQNLGWVLGANNGRADQIGPGVVLKLGTGDYRCFMENVTGVKAIDVGNQPGAFDYDTGTIYGTSTDGTTWTLTAQDDGANALINVTNVTTDAAGNEATFKAAAQGEISISTVMYDPDDALWKAWGHAGNNTGPRNCYYLTNPAGTPFVVGTWVVMNDGQPVLVGLPDTASTSDMKVIRVHASLMVALHNAGNSKINVASSTDRGLTWTKIGVGIDIGATGQWDHIAVGGCDVVYDERTGMWAIWYGGSNGGPTGAGDGIGFAYTSDLTSVPYTKGAYNPVLCKKHRASANANIESQGPLVSQSVYQDGNTWRLIIHADNAVSGVTGFRGRIEATLTDPATNSLPFSRRDRQIVTLI